MLVPNVDIVRQSAQLYDEFEGNEDYIHIPDIQQMLHNLQNFPVIGAINTETGELEGIATIKYHENKQGDIDSYYPKEGAKFFNITGVIVRQRDDMLNKGLGTNLYAASILGLQRYADSHPEEKFELKADIDCTNLRSLYALINGTENLQARGLVGEGKELEAILDGIYIVRDEEGHFVEAPTYVPTINLKPKEIRRESWNTEEEKIAAEKVFSFSVNQNHPKHRKYEKLLDTILEMISQNESCIATQTRDNDSGIVTYISVENLKIYIEEMKIERNGAENIGTKRTPKKDVHQFVGPMPNVVVPEEEKEEEERW